ncbi:GT4 family glycosyltransferase PelF [Cytobacillus suaedae]|nr:GT4 family glycosyltransferase PelF [Cytobacillus suaedae]
MKICIIAEGSYPYITGGVSSWIQSLIQSMPEHQFIIYAIGAEEKLRGNFKYKLPENVLGVEEIFLDSYLTDEPRWGKRYKLTDIEKVALRSLLDSSSSDWQVLFNLFSSKKLDSVSNFLTSKDFYDIIQEVCLDKYAHLPFTDMYWTLRSMVLPLFLSIVHPVPKADLYHSVSTGYAGVIGSLAKYRYKKPYIVTEHGIYTREREEEIIKADWVKGHFKELWIQYFYNMSNCAYHFTDQVVTLFQKNKEVQIDIGCPEEKIKIIPNGVVQQSQNRTDGRIDPDVINIGAIVRIVPIKDIKTLLHSFALVKREIPKAVLYIMGPSDENEEYLEECMFLMNNIELQDVIFTGEVDVNEYMVRMDLLVLSSISEGQPLAVLEGMAAGKPYVTTDVGSCKELLYGNNDEYGQAGIVVPIMHYTQMAQAIIKLCKSEQLRKNMGLNGRERASSLYTKEAFINSYKSLYNELVELSWQV